MSATMPSISGGCIHDIDTAVLDIARTYAAAMEDAGIAPIAWAVRGLEKPRRGGLRELVAHYESDPQPDGTVVEFVGPDDMSIFCGRGDQYGGWYAEISRSDRVAPDRAWMDLAIEIVTRAIGSPGFQYGLVRREMGIEFPFAPPIAAANHFVVTTDALVAAKYDDPAVFWRAWETIEERGDYRLCTRALDALDEPRWLGATFESTMACGRAAKPGTLKFPGVTPKATPWLAPWWEFGPLEDEKAGEPVLSLVGYDEATRTVEFAGYVPPGRHVLAQEIHRVRILARGKRDGQGRPIDMVRIVFFDEAMARAERRPLLDAGGKVFFTSRPSGALVEVTD